MSSSEESSDSTPVPAQVKEVEPPDNLPIRMCSTVVRGFGRGSSDLGIPTANLDFSNKDKYQISCGRTFDDLPTGIYWGYCRIGGDDSNTNNDVYTTACSIGYNPTYGNKLKTVEPHLIAPELDERRHKSSCGESVLGDFYDQKIRLSIVGYLRPELPFEGIDKLIVAIKNDIKNSVQEASNTDNNKHNEIAIKEKAWVGSSESI